MVIRYEKSANHSGNAGRMTFESLVYGATLSVIRLSIILRGDHMALGTS